MLPNEDVSPDLREFMDSNKLTDDDGVLIGDNWINYKKEKPAIGEWFLAIWLADGYKIECKCKFTSEYDDYTKTYYDHLEIEDEDCQWLKQEAFNPWNTILYWKYLNDNDTSKN